MSEYDTKTIKPVGNQPKEDRRRVYIWGRDNETGTFCEVVDTVPVSWITPEFWWLSDVNFIKEEFIRNQLPEYQYVMDSAKRLIGYKLFPMIESASFNSNQDQYLPDATYGEFLRECHAMAQKDWEERSK